MLKWLHLQVRRQLEYSIAAAKGITLRKPPGTMDAVREIYRSNGLKGLYTGFPLHFSEYHYQILSVHLF
jgi:hypothetical protein